MPTSSVLFPRKLHVCVHKVIRSSIQLKGVFIFIFLPSICLMATKETFQLLAVQYQGEFPAIFFLFFWYQPPPIPLALRKRTFLYKKRKPLPLFQFYLPDICSFL